MPDALPTVRLWAVLASHADETWRVDFQCVYSCLVWTVMVPDVRGSNNSLPVQLGLRLNIKDCRLQSRHSKLRIIMQAPVTAFKVEDNDAG